MAGRSLEDIQQNEYRTYTQATVHPPISPSNLAELYCQYILAILDNRAPTTIKISLGSPYYNVDSAVMIPDVGGYSNFSRILRSWFDPAKPFNNWMRPPFEVIADCILSNIEDTTIDTIEVEVNDDKTDYGFIMEALYNVNKRMDVLIGPYKPRKKPHYFLTNRTGAVRYYIDERVIDPDLRNLAILMEPGITRREESPAHPLRGLPTDVAGRIKSMLRFSKRHRRRRRSHRFHRP